MFSTGFSSGERDGSRIRVRFFGIVSFSGRVPAGAVEEQDGVGAAGDGLPISSRWACMASVSAKGMARAAPTPRAGQMAPNR